MRRIVLRLLFTPVVCALLTTGCFNHDRSHPPSPVDSRIVMTLHERLAPTGRTLELGAATEKIYGCCNFSILWRVEPDPVALEIQFTGISMPDICATALGPATATIPLGPTVTGSRILSLHSSGGTYGARLVVSADSIQVSGGTGTGFVFPAPTLHRVPPGTIWGLIGWGPSDQSARAQRFLDSLVTVGAQRVALIPGTYEYFVVAPGGTVSIPGNSGFYYDRAFALHYTGDGSVIGDVVHAFGDSLWISVYDDRGDSWLSWMMGARAARAARARAGG